jgi:hypothetical protein
MVQTSTTLKLSDFELLEVVTEDGRRLGRVFDLRVHGRPTTKWKPPEMAIDAVVYGTLGFLERVGVRKASSQTIGWDQVVALRPGEIVVAARPPPG